MQLRIKGINSFSFKDVLCQCTNVDICCLCFIIDFYVSFCSSGLTTQASKDKHVTSVIDECNNYYFTSKTPAGRHATEGHHTSVTTKRDTVSRSKEGCFPLGYVGVSSDANSFPNRFSSSSYVDPWCSNPHIMLDTDHPMQRDRSVTGGHGRPAGPDTYFPGYIVMGNLRLQLA